MSGITPRIRAELSANAAEEDGCKFFDVQDPKSGASMRMYDFEWLIAEQMNGARRFEEVADWARSALGIDPEAESLAQFAAQLAHFGFFELEGAAVAPQARQPMAAQPMAPLVEIDITPPTPSPAAAIPMPEIEEPIEQEQVTALHQGTFADTDDERTMQSTQTRELIEKSRRTSDFDEPAPTVRKPLGRIETKSVPQPIDSVRPGAIKEGREPSGEFPAEGPTTVSPRSQPAAPIPSPAEQMAKPQPAAPKPSPAARRPAAASAPRGEEAIIQEPPKSRLGLALVILLLLAGAAAGGAWYLGYLPFGIAEVTVQTADAKDAVRLYDAKAAVEKGEGVTLSFGEAGKVTDVVAVGTEVKPGTPIATLDGYAKVEKELADVRDRAAFYERQAQAAHAKGQEEAAKKLDTKVADKQRLLKELQTRASRMRLTAAAPGTVTEVSVAAGAEVKAGTSAAKIGNDTKMVEFKIPEAEAAKLTVDSEAFIQLASGGAAIPGKVSKVSPTGEVTLELTGEAVKPGDEVYLVKTTLKHAVKVPVSALVNKNSVFVFTDGVAKLKQVTIVDQDAKEAYVAAGLSPGEKIITSSHEQLKDKQRVSVKP